MEYVEGTELKEVLQQPNGLMPFDQALRIAKQSLAAFQYAYENGILHRDIKPANIMIDKQGNSKIMDFGIAKVAGAATHDTAASMLSVHYTPPERFDPSRTVDARSDIYALGLVFYELFTGRRPFEAEETSQIMFWHLNEIPEPPETYVSGLPSEVSTAIETALEKDPDDRFQDFKEFSDALGEGTPGIDYTSQLVDNEATAIDQTIITSAVPSKAIKKRKKKKGSGFSAPLVAGIAAAIVALIVVGFFAFRAFLPQDQVRTEIKKAPKPTIAIEGGVLNTKGYTEITHEKDGSVMIYIPAGEFIIGSDNYSWEQPVQTIKLDEYLIDKYPVSNSQFQKFVEETQYITDAEKSGGGEVKIARRWRAMEGATWRKPDGAESIVGREDHPVSQVSYNDALAYCQWAGKDLPTEAQWEKAARGPVGSVYPWGDTDPDDTIANFVDSFIDGTTSITSYEKGQSYYGAFDMAGNVYQWCKDWYVGEGSERESENPAGPETGTDRVLKGGAFTEGFDNLRSASREKAEPVVSRNIYGFRCVKKKE
jgi:serine/threonine-protein kinase